MRSGDTLIPRLWRYADKSYWEESNFCCFGMRFFTHISGTSYRHSAIFKLSYICNSWTRYQIFWRRNEVLKWRNFLKTFNCLGIRGSICRLREAKRLIMQECRQLSLWFRIRSNAIGFRPHCLDNSTWRTWFEECTVQTSTTAKESNFFCFGMRLVTDFSRTSNWHSANSQADKYSHCISIILYFNSGD